MPQLEMKGEYRDQLKKCYTGVCGHEPHSGEVVCQRCRNGHTVQGNFMDMCDFCCIQCLQGAEDMVVMKMLTQDEADRLVNGIREANSKWRQI